MKKLVIISFAAFFFFILLVVGYFFLIQKNFYPRLMTAQIIPGPNEAVFNISPASGTFYINNNFTVDLRINTSAGITALKADLSFPASLISVDSIDISDSVFTTFWENTYNNTTGRIQLQASTPTPGFLGSSGQIARITFRAIGAGVAAVVYGSSSLALKPDDSNILNLTNSTGGSFVVLSGTPLPTCVNCSLGIPLVSPANPVANQSFTITCPTSISSYDCLNAYAGSNSCVFSSWSGNNAVFVCPGLAAGTYSDRCVSKTGTGSNCCFSEVSNYFTVLSQQTGGGSGGGGGGGGSDTNPTTTFDGKIPKLIGDLNEDGVVNIYDLSILLSNWRKSTTKYDISGDGVIDIYDLSIMLSNWLKMI